MQLSRNVLLALALAPALSLMAPMRRVRGRSLRRDALLNAPRKEDQWYEGLSTDPGAAGKVSDAAKASRGCVEGRSPRRASRKRRTRYAESLQTKDVAMDDVIAVIDAEFAYSDVGFSVGTVENAPGTNAGGRAAAVSSTRVEREPLASSGRDASRIVGQEQQDPQLRVPGSVEAIWFLGARRVHDTIPRRASNTDAPRDACPGS